MTKVKQQLNKLQASIERIRFRLEEMKVETGVIENKIETF